MPIDDITKKVSDRYASAASAGEQMCCPTSYDLAMLKSFIPEEVLKISYGAAPQPGCRPSYPAKRFWTSDRVPGSTASRPRGSSDPPVLSLVWT